MNRIIVLGNYSPSNYDSSRVVSINGIAPTVKENHGTITGVVIKQNEMEKKMVLYYKHKNNGLEKVCQSSKLSRIDLVMREWLLNNKGYSVSEFKYFIDNEKICIYFGSNYHIFVITEYTNYDINQIKKEYKKIENN